MRHESVKHGVEGVTEALQKAPLTPRERDVVALTANIIGAQASAAKMSRSVRRPFPDCHTRNSERRAQFGGGSRRTSRPRRCLSRGFARCAYCMVLAWTSWALQRLCGNTGLRTGLDGNSFGPRGHDGTTRADDYPVSPGPRLASARRPARESFKSTRVGVRGEAIVGAALVSLVIAVPLFAWGVLSISDFSGID